MTSIQAQRKMRQDLHQHPQRDEVNEAELEEKHGLIAERQAVGDCLRLKGRPAAAVLRGTRG